MSIRCARSTGPAMFGLVASLALSLGLCAPPAAAAPRSARASTLPLTLVHQSPWVTPTPPGSPRTFTLEVAPGAGVPASDEVVVTLFTQLTTRTGFEETLKTAPTGARLDQTHPVALSSMPSAGGRARSLAISVLPTPTASPPAPAGAPTLDLHCTATATCTGGVYPLVVSLIKPTAGGGHVSVAHSSFTTYLTYAAAKSTTPLDFAWVVPVSAPVNVRAAGSPRASLAAPTKSTADALAGLVATLAARPAIPLTVAASPETLQTLAAKKGAPARAVSELSAMSSGDQVDRQFLAEPYVPVDLGALSGAGEGEEITAQSELGASVSKSLGVLTTVHPGIWVATGTVGTDLRAALDEVHDSELVLPSADLAPPRGVEGTWASAFTMPLGKGAPTVAAASDGELAAHFTSDPADPALEANQLLADLAMIHFEAPNTPTPRAMVAVPPQGWVPSKAFDTELLAGLSTNPVVRPTTLAGVFSAFSSQLTAATGPSRRLATGGPGPALSPTLARKITAARLRLTAFTSAVPGNPPVKSRLDQLLLASESDTLSPAAMTGGVDAFGHALDGQLSQVQLATQRTVTLTSQTGFIPVTIVSSASYPVKGTLVLSGGRFLFPHGSTRPLRLDHPTNPTRFEVEARTSGDLPLEAVFKSPTGNLVIASGQLTIRSTATSIVGVALTVLALVVLLGWWARTWWGGRKRRRAAEGPG